MKYHRIIIGAYCLLFIILGTSYFQGGDYANHYQKAKIGCENPLTIWNTEACEKYAPLFHFISKPFSFHENAFYYFTIFLFAILTPLVIHYYTKNWVSTLLYFTLSNYVFFFMDGIFSQATANILLLILFLTKNKHIEIAILPLLIFSHGSAFAAGIIILLFKHIDQAPIYCSSFFGKEKIESLYASIPIVNTGSLLQINSLVHYVIKIFPAPYLYLSLLYAYRTNKKTLYLTLFLTLAGVFYSTRVFYLVFLLNIPNLTKYYETLEKKQKVYFILGLILIGVYQLYLFLNYKKTC